MYHVVVLVVDYYADVYGPYNLKPNEDTLKRLRRLYPTSDKVNITVLEEDQMFLLDLAGIGKDNIFAYPVN